MGTLLNGSEKNLFDSVAVEVTRLVGVEKCVLWKFSAFTSVSGNISVDCLYSEPAQGVTGPPAQHYTPFNVLGFFQEPTHTAQALDQGEDELIEGRFFFVRKNLEFMKVPRDQFGDLVSVGDIVQIFHKKYAFGFWYFDLRDIDRTGFINDSQEFTHYSCDIVRNTNFFPERKITDT